MAKKMQKTWKRAILPDHDRDVFVVLRMVKESGMSDREVAIKSGISPHTIANWRKGYKNGGTRYPSNVRLENVATACGYSRAGWAKSGFQDVKKAEFFDDTPVPNPRKKKAGKKAGKRLVGGKVIPFPASKDVDAPGQKLPVAV